ncbi:MAG TPA: hypothetical protein VFE71_06480, partial [Bacteroidales bacterium]|nr:hypothetical protein [Bacteroidales bacterium]
IIHVTHDYCDAISLAKKVGVIHNGKIIQEGSVEEVFSNPANRFVARYAGIRNFFKVNILRENGFLIGVTENDVRFKLNGVNPASDSLLLIKNDTITLKDKISDDSKINSIKGIVTEIIPSQFGLEITVDAGDLFYVNMSGSEATKFKLVENKEVWVNFPADAIVLIDGN